MHWIALFLIWSLPLFAQLEKGTLLFEAKQYPEAKEEFSLLLDEDLTPWQRSIVHYNMATTLLEMGRYDDALNLLFAIPTAHAPLLNTYVKNNTAVALLRKAEQENSVPAWRDALLATEEAESANCALKKLEGEKLCRPRTDLIKMAATAKQQLIHLLQEKEKSLLADPSAQEAIPLLRRSVNDALSHLTFLQKFDTPAYRAYFSEEAATWIPLWEAMNNVSTAKKQYLSALTSMQKGEDAESEKALKEALAHLPKEEASPQAQYERVLSHRILYPALIEEIQDSKNQELLTKSVDAAEEGDTPLARLYLMEALQNTKREQAPQTAKEILEVAVKEQQHALNLNRYQGGHPLVLAAQERVLTTISPFIKQLYQEQIAANTCQREPWDTVLPLYHKGFDEAEQAQQLLTPKSFSAQLALAKQAQVVRDWQEALKKWEAPKKEEKEQDKTAQELQQMQEQDVKPVKPRPKLIMPGVKPW